MLSKNGSVALVRLRGAGPLPEMVRDEAGDRGLLKALHNAELPFEVLAHRDTPIPMTLMSSLFEASAHLMGDRSFGLAVGKRMSYQVYGLWSLSSAQSPDLKRAIKRLSSTIWAQTSHFGMTLTEEGNDCVWRFVPPMAQKNSVQWADHLIYPMIAFARVYLGENWQPRWVEVGYPRDKSTQLIEKKLGHDLRCNGLGIAIPFTREEVLRRHPDAVEGAGMPLILKQVTDDLLLSDAKEPARSFSAVVSLRLLAGQSDIEGAAELVKSGVQGLQRRLRTTGYTYKNIVELARRERAVSLLRDTDLSVAEIAFALGYEEHANFTRAFNRWMGCSPSAFRASVL